MFFSVSKTRKILHPGSEILLLISHEEKERQKNVFLCQFCDFQRGLKLHSVLANLSRSVQEFTRYYHLMKNTDVKKQRE